MSIVQMIKGGAIALMALLLLAGCGRKEAPQVVVDPDAKPAILNLIDNNEGNLLTLNFSLQGNPAGVGYQIDRTEMDPYCKCPGFWRRYDEALPHAKRMEKPIQKLIPIRTADKEFLFRIRAVDINGHVGPWSKTISARYYDPLAD